MSNEGGPGWWLAADGRMYPPEMHPNYQAVPPPPTYVASPYAPVAQPQSTSGTAIASLVTSLVGLGPIAVILGHVALGQIKRSMGAMGGRGLAIAGLVIGYLETAVVVLGILAGVAVFAVGNSTSTAQLNACRVEKRTIQTAAEALRGLSDDARYPSVDELSAEPDPFLEFPVDESRWDYSVSDDGSVLTVTGIGECAGT